MAAFAGVGGVLALSAITWTASSGEAPEARSGHDAARNDEDRNWQDVLQASIPAVVTIQFSSPRSFQFQNQGSGVGTGFIVDLENGIILTNRHLMGYGPVVATAEFYNQKWIDLTPLYVDPVHDFAFYKFDPARAKKVCPRLSEIPLRPEAAVVGANVRIVGNDAGQKLSILAGTLARLDRAPPGFAPSRPNDFNTHYYQASTAATHGSSGSPVIDRSGAAIALNAAATRNANVTMLLPLHRVKRALELLRRGETVSRGSIQTTFDFSPLPPKSGSGDGRPAEALRVSKVIPGGPGSAKLKVNDYVLSINGRPAKDFTVLEDILDANVGQDVTLTVLRPSSVGGGGSSPGSSRGISVSETVETVRVHVDDLHAFTPRSMIELDGAVLHDISYHIARNFNLPLQQSGNTGSHAAPASAVTGAAGPAGGVYVASAGHGELARRGLRPGTLVRAVNGKPTPTLAALEDVLVGIPDGAEVSFRLSHVQTPKSEVIMPVPVTRCYYPAVRRDRQVGSAEWGAAAPLRSAAPAAQEGGFLTSQVVFDPGRSKAEAALSRSLVSVECRVPFLVDGMGSHFFEGTGVVADAEEGLVVVDRNTVPTTLADARVGFGDLASVPAQVVYVSPVHNLAVIRYDTKLAAGAPVRAAEFSTRFAYGDPVVAVGLVGDRRSGKRLVSATGTVQRMPKYTTVLSRSSVYLDPSFNPLCAREGGLPKHIQDGVAVEADAPHRVLWYRGSVPGTRSLVGTPSSVIQETLSLARRQIAHDAAAAKARQGGSNGPNSTSPVTDAKERASGPTLQSLGVEMEKLSVKRARVLGIRDAWVRGAVERATEAKAWPPTFLSVRRRWDSAPAAEVLRDGDIILAVDGEPVHDFEQVSRSVRAHGAGSDRRTSLVSVTVHRDGEERTVRVPTTPLPNSDTKEIILFSGATFQRPPFALSQLFGIDPEGVIVAGIAPGSPAVMAGLSPLDIVMEVDQVPTPDLQSFVREVCTPRGVERSLRTRSVKGQETVKVVRSQQSSDSFFPLEVVRKDAAGGEWVRRPISS